LAHKGRSPLQQIAERDRIRERISQVTTADDLGETGERLEGFGLRRLTAPFALRR